MKKFLMVLLLLMCTSVGANDLVIHYADSIKADTAAETVRCDTVYSPAMDIRGLNRIHFFCELLSDNYDTAWADDTFFVNFQHSFNQTTWNEVLVDTLLASGTGWSAMDLNTTDSIIGNWGRAMLIHWDTIGADTPDIEDNIYHKTLRLWIGGKK